jgi:hypothetical protein
MSMFLCARCDEMADSDEGCEQYGKNGTELICIDCMNDLEDEANQGPADSWARYDQATKALKQARADMSYDGIKSKLLAMGCPPDIAEELAREKSK